MSTTDLHERFDELIKFGKTLLKPEFYVWRTEDLSKKARWEAECQHLLERALGKDSVFLKSFQKALSHRNIEIHVPEGLSIMEGAKEELLRRKTDKLDTIEKKIKEEKAEAKRRAAVAETKQWGSVIELIDMLREELKRRTKVDQDISEIRKEIGEVSRRRIFSCSNCGNPYDAYPPDDLHDTVSLQKPSQKDGDMIMKIIHDCSKCKHPITLYWYRRKPDISS